MALNFFNNIGKALDPKQNGVEEAFDPAQNGFIKALDPTQNGLIQALDPNQNGVANALDPKKNGIAAVFTRDIVKENYIDPFTAFIVNTAVPTVTKTIIEPVKKTVFAPVASKLTPFQIQMQEQVKAQLLQLKKTKWYCSSFRKYF